VDEQSCGLKKEPMVEISMQTTQTTASYRRDTFILTALLILATWNYLDRAAIGILQEPIKKEFGLSDFQLGLLGGPAFAFLYVILGFPFARLSERYNRVRIRTTRGLDEAE
jgi:sugar phosphate permease